MGITIKRYPLSRFEARDTTLLPAASLLSIKSPELTHLARSNLCTAGPTSPRSGGLRSGLYVCGARAPSPPLPPAAPASSASGAPMSVGRRGGSVWRNHTPSGPPGWECHAPPCPRSVPRASPTAPWGTGGSGQRGPRPSSHSTARTRSVRGAWHLVGSCPDPTHATVTEAPERHVLLFGSQAHLRIPPLLAFPLGCSGPGCLGCGFFTIIQVSFWSQTKCFLLGGISSHCPGWLYLPTHPRSLHIALFNYFMSLFKNLTCFLRFFDVPSSFSLNQV